MHSIDPRVETVPGLRPVTLQEHQKILSAWTGELGKRPRKGAGKVTKVIGWALCAMALADLVAAGIQAALIPAGIGIALILAGRSSSNHSIRKNECLDNLEQQKYLVAPAYATKIWVTGDADSQSHGFCEAQYPNGQMLPGVYRMPTLVARDLYKKDIESCPILLIQIENADILLTIPV